MQNLGRNHSLDGKIVRTGGKDLALELEVKGYDWILKS